MIQRIAQHKLRQLAENFKTVAVVGPRQSGKTTLVKATFPDKRYVSLENPDNRSFAIEDPRGFLNDYKSGAIFDEIQRVPQLFSYLQEIIDFSNKKGLFVFTGSNNLLLQENISQSLAGRIAYLTLLPFNISELEKVEDIDVSDDAIIFNGYYPPIYDQKIPAEDWYQNYIKTYIERDVRLIKNINDLYLFEKFIKILAGRTSQELNFNSISIESGVDIKTVQSWIGILENSYIVYLLRPYYKNFNKTVVKRPKLYFYDTGIVCALLGIKNKNQLHSYPLRGEIFETMVVGEIVKKYTNFGNVPSIYYWRDKAGHEVDLIIEGESPMAIEIKSGQTVSSDWFKNLIYFSRISEVNNSCILYGGDIVQRRSEKITVLNWKKFEF